MKVSFVKRGIILGRITLLTILLGSNSLSIADVAIIVHPSNSAEISEDSIRHIFLGKDNNFSDNKKAVPIELAQGNARKLFLKNYLHKSETELQHLWSIKTFTGKGQPPKKYPNDEEIKKLVAKNPEMIGFIDTSSVDDSIKVAEIKKSASRFNSDK